VLEWLEGRTLAEEMAVRRRDGAAPWTLQDAVALLTPAAEALAVLDDPARVSRIKQDLAEVRSRLGGPGASRRAAEALLLEAKKLDRVGASV
jgi:hypothetical protein